MPLIDAEAVAASAVTLLASTIVTAYLADCIGFAIVPFVVLAVAVAAAAIVYVGLTRHATRDGASLTAFAASVAGTFGWLLWIARPDFLPPGSGPDLTHHLSLLEYIQQHWSLVHDVRLSEYLGEMVDYTPGSHLLAVLAGAWFGSDALHAVYPTVAATVALKGGCIFLVARRLLPLDATRLPFAIVAVVLLFLARQHFLGSFTEQSFLAQVVAELFAVAMWLALIVWNQRPSREATAMFAFAGVAAFLTWPVWTGPLLLAFAVTALRHGELARSTRLLDLVLAGAPIGVAALIHGARHVGGFRMAGTGGFVIRPTPDVLGWWFIALAAGGLVHSLVDRRGRAVALLLAAIALQAAALYATAASSGAAAPYLSLKMFYLAVYPLTVGMTLMLAALWRVGAAALRLPERRSGTGAWIAAGLIAVAVVRPLAALPRPRATVTQPVLDAAQWARAQAPAGCIDYLVVNGDTAYWLHLAVFGQPRTTGRAANDDTFDARKELVRWIMPNGLPLAVTDDLEALPRDIRTNVDVLARFGPAAVVRRRGPSQPCS